MIIWRGWGWITAVILFGALVLTQLIVDGIAGDGVYTANAVLYAGIAFVIGGAATYAVSYRLEGRNDLFFIPVKVWGYLGIAAGSLMASAGLLGVRP